MHKKTAREKTPTLEQIMSTESLTIQELFKQPNILPRIRSAMDVFIKYCMEDPTRIITMINFGVKQAQLNTPQQQKLAEICNSLICGDDDLILAVLIGSSSPDSAKTSDNEEENLSKENEQSKEEQFLNKYQHLINLLDYAGSEEAHPVSLTYFTKMLQVVIDQRVVELFEFFTRKREYIDLLIEQSVKCENVASTLANFISQQQDTKNYRALKSQVITKFMKKLQDCIELSYFMFLNLFQFTDMVFSKTKYRTEEPTQLSTLSSCLVSAQTVEFYLANVLKNINENSFRNSTKVLLEIVSRKIIDEESDLFYSRNDPNYVSEPTINFQLSSLYHNFSLLTKLKIPQDYENMTKLMFYELLLKITKTLNWKIQEINNIIKCEIYLLRALKRATSKGMIKVCIGEVICQVIEKIQSLSTRQVMMIVSALNPDERNIQKQNVPYEVKIMLILTNKDKEFFKHFKQCQIEQKLQQYKETLSPSQFLQNHQKYNSTKQLQFINQIQIKTHPKTAGNYKKHRRTPAVSMCDEAPNDIVTLPDLPPEKEIKILPFMNFREITLEEQVCKQNFGQNIEYQADSGDSQKLKQSTIQYFVPHFPIF